MTVKEAILKYKLDRRHKWFAFYGEVVRDIKVTLHCSGCNGEGCQECGYTGKSKSGFPCPAMDENNNPIKTTDKDFTYEAPKVFN